MRGKFAAESVQIVNFAVVMLLAILCTFIGENIRGGVPVLGRCLYKNGDESDRKDALDLFFGHHKIARSLGNAWASPIHFWAKHRVTGHGPELKTISSLPKQHSCILFPHVLDVELAWSDCDMVGNNSQ